MNRFRTKKRGKDDASIGGRPSMEVEPSGPFRMFGRRKPQANASQKELDLATALPSSDDFRTSLLLTGLSARFSMLREQDDPNSMLGKASDDSVLFPKRQSRLADFGGFGGGLHDISEVESLKAPALTRLDSYQSDDASATNGSIMARSKPLEGNNLFGGRQKIYKLNPGSKAGMSGRALYDDDVAQSAFQKWRQAEKERKLSREEDTFDETPFDYNRRRETSSTTSSIPSATRDSTAATSISSQPSSIQETQPISHSSGLERTTRRNQRLYEQGLTQDLQEQQSSALFRIDTLSKQRPLDSRNPDPTISSPTSLTFSDRTFDRRQVLAKASAPNLRSLNLSALGSVQTSPADSFTKFQRQEPNQTYFPVTNPPLSPPMSETGEQPTLIVQPNDHGKSTAMGVFSRPALPYDESRYAQRQRQLQHGRDTSASASPTGSGMWPMEQEQGSPSAQMTSKETCTSPKNDVGISVVKENRGMTFFDDSDEGSVDIEAAQPTVAPQAALDRPNDHDHPALRRHALPNPLLLSKEASRVDNSSPHPEPEDDVPEDSPTLGPAAGLSGMVRQHLRNDSVASSVYGSVPTDAGFTRKETESNHAAQNHAANPHVEVAIQEQDAFAQRLADRAQLVRERLTTYVESDTDRSAPATPQSELNRELGSSKSNGLGILRQKSSRSSLFDKNEKERGRSKSTRLPTSQPVARTSPSPEKPPSNRLGQPTREGFRDASEPNLADKEERVHVGLKAFRQARRELQRMKELELQQRHNQKSSPVQERPPNNRVASYEHGPPPAMFNNNHGGRSRAGSRATSERDRSGSDASNGGRSYSRGPRHQHGPAAYDDHFGRPGVASSPTMYSSVPPAYLAGGIMKPSNGLSGFGSSSRHGSPTRTAQQPDTPQNKMNRNGSLLRSAASSPNLHDSAVAPPLPPINPRRKTGFMRRSEEGSALNHTSPTGFYPGPDYTVYQPRADHTNGQLSKGQPRHSPHHGTVRPAPPPYVANLSGISM